MIISCIGDSLTEGDYGVYGKRGIADIHKENYPYFLGEYTGAEVHNLGKCGFTSTTYREYYEQGNVDVKKSDIVIIMLGTNGGLDYDADIQGNRDYEAIIDRCRCDAPLAEIVLCTPPHATENPEYSNFGYASNVEKAVRFVRKFAEKNQFKVIDVAKCSAYTAENEKIMQPNDGLHFSKIGYKTLAEYIAKNLYSMYPSLFRGKEID